MSETTPVITGFNGEAIPCIQYPDPQHKGVFVPMRAFVRGMGLEWANQLRSMKQDPLLRDAFTLLTTTSHGRDGKTYPVRMVCLPLHLFYVWLLRVDAAAPFAEHDPRREILLRYQQEFVGVLRSHVYGGEAPFTEESFERILDRKLDLLGKKIAPRRETRLYGRKLLNKIFGTHIRAVVKGADGYAYHFLTNDKTITVPAKEFSSRAKFLAALSKRAKVVGCIESEREWNNFLKVIRKHV